MTTFLQVDGLKKYFPLGKGILSSDKRHVRAVDDVNFTMRQGETLGLVGESGSGKTTLGRCILRLIEPTEGEIIFDGFDVMGANNHSLKEMRRQMQIIFQDPYGSLTPRMRLRSLLKEPLKIHKLYHGQDIEDNIVEAMTRVGLQPDYMHRFPHELSGGQRQRVAIARALMLHPKLIIADEPVSALDVSIQAQILNLMVKLQNEMGLSYLFITHDLSVVKYMADRIAVMYLGRIVEISKREELFINPLHPYTRALLSAIPRVRKKNGVNESKIHLEGEIPSPINPPTGCHFHPRCPQRTEDCKVLKPKLREMGNEHMVACPEC